MRLRAPRTPKLTSPFFDDDEQNDHDYRSGAVYFRSLQDHTLYADVTFGFEFEFEEDRSDFSSSLFFTMVVSLVATRQQCVHLLCGYLHYSVLVFRVQFLFTTPGLQEQVQLKVLISHRPMQKAQAVLMLLQVVVGVCVPVVVRAPQSLQKQLLFTISRSPFNICCGWFRCSWPGREELDFLQ